MIHHSNRLNKQNNQKERSSLRYFTTAEKYHKIRISDSARKGWSFFDFSDSEDSKFDVDQRYKYGFGDPVHRKQHDIERKVLLLRAEEEVMYVDEPEEQMHERQKSSNIVKQVKSCQHAHDLYGMSALNFSPKQQKYLSPEVDKDPPRRSDQLALKEHHHDCHPHEHDWEVNRVTFVGLSVVVSKKLAKFCEVFRVVESLLGQLPQRTSHLPIYYTSSKLTTLKFPNTKEFCQKKLFKMLGETDDINDHL